MIDLNLAIGTIDHYFICYFPSTNHPRVTVVIIIAFMLQF